jgi:hypothetical protein
MGVALGQAIAAAVAKPNQPVIHLSGDSAIGRDYGDSLLDALASRPSPHILNLDGAPFPQALPRLLDAAQKARVVSS